MKDIELLLTARNMKIEDKFNENENEYCRRGTIEFERISGMKFYYFYHKKSNQYFIFRC
jgi:hypothetical protein